MARRHRSYALRPLCSISPADRWGIGEIAPRGSRLYFKGGRGYATGLLDHQVGVLVRDCARVSLAVLTMYDRIAHLWQGDLERDLRASAHWIADPVSAQAQADQ